ncbi:MAG: efflux RND transporter permease subunit [Candidatus Hydrogenedentes bacterium]|nr:efflux RND transporter permease subunit [Candidatus Hydrogenedentota bacterium]
MKDIIRSIVANNVFANVVMVIILVVGTIAAFTMVRESMPEFELGLIAIEVPFPGADPEEVEEGICHRIEAAIDGLEGVKDYNTTAWEGFASVEVWAEQGYDIEKLKDSVRNAVDSISTFPARAEKPQIYEVRDEDETIHLALWGSLPERQLKEWAETVRDDLQRLPHISRVEVYGARRYEINIEVSKERLWEYGLTLDNVTEAVYRGSLNLPAGTIRTEGEEIRIRTIGRKYNGRDFAAVVIKSSPSGDIITLGDVADIRDTFTENPSYSNFNDHPCVHVAVLKAKGEDSLAQAELTREYAANKQKELPAGLNITPCFDDTEFVTGQIALLSEDAVSGLILVVLVLWLFLNTRLSFWIAMGIPVSFAGALCILWMIGETINQISLIAFIVVLGIVVDDAIVLGEAIFAHRQRGDGPLEAAVAGVSEVGAPVFAAVMTMITAFIPLAFIPGIMGQIVAVMPIVVISTMIVSTIESLFLLPTHLNHLPDPNLPEKPRPRWQQRFIAFHAAFPRGLEWFARHMYQPAVRTAIRHRYVTLCCAISVLLVTGGIVAGGFVRVIFWPPVDGNSLDAFVEFPPGTPGEVTRDAVEQTRRAFERVAERTKTESGEPLLRNIFTRVNSFQPNFGFIAVEMLHSSARGVHSQDLAAAWQKEVGAIPGAVQQSFHEDTIGMGGPPIEIWLQGKDLNALRNAANELKAKLATYDGVYQIADDFRAGRTEIQVRLKPEAHALGLTLDQVARHLYTGYYGEEAQRFQRGRDDVRVRIRYPEDERQTLAELERVRVRTPQGFDVPLMSVAEIAAAPGVSSIKGSNGLRRIAVYASADFNKANPSEIVTDLGANYLDSLCAQYGNLTWTVEGVEESNRETLAGIQRGFAIAALGIFVILATIFRSYVQPVVIMLIIPFAMVGAVLGHLAMGIPLTFLSLFGLIALAGIVVNDSIVLIECVNELIAGGTPVYDALAQAGVRRFRAIFLTSVTTFIGLGPLVWERDLQAQIVIPMGISIAAGSAFATFVTLLFTPSLLAITNDARRLAHRALHKQWPEPEDVEPARDRRRPPVGAPAPHGAPDLA